MALPTFDGFSLQDDNYIITDIEYRTIPVRDIVMESISRKPGKKLLSQEFAERRIHMAGYILGSNNSDLISKIDNLHDNVTRRDSGILSIDVNREIKASVSLVSIADPHYSQSMVPFEMEFVAAEPFYKGTQLNVNFTTTSGISSQQITLTISGSVFAEPSIRYNAPGSTGTTTTSGIIIEYGPTTETLTWSGGASPLSYGSIVKFDYENQIILEDATEVEAAGVFSRWEPGETTFTLTYSGLIQGGSIDFTYRPRYL